MAAPTMPVPAIAAVLPCSVLHSRRSQKCAFWSPTARTASRLMAIII